MQSSDSGPIIIESSKGRVFPLKSLQLNPKSSATWKTYSRMNCQMLLARSIFLRRDSYLPVLEIKQHIQMSKCIPCTFFLPAVLMIRKQKNSEIGDLTCLILEIKSRRGKRYLNNCIYIYDDRK